MKLKHSLLVVLALVIGLAMVGCNGEKPEATADGDGEAAVAAVEFVNVRCPIMNSPIDAAKVPASLQREHKGQKVALCCGGCPETWDALSDDEKDAKLAAVTE